MTTKKIFLTVLSLVLVLTMLVSCNNTGNGGDTEAPETEPVVEKLLLEDMKNYILVRPEKIGDDLSVILTRFKKSIENTIGVDSIKYKDDLYREGVESLKINEFEILVGRTNRPETAEFLNELRYDDYGYTVINKKIVIAGHTEETTMLAVSLFEKEMLSADMSNGVFLEGNPNVVKSEYKTENMTIGGLPVKGLRIVYPGSNKLSEKMFAETISEALSNISGYYVDVCSDKGLELADTDNVILVGDSTRVKRLAKPTGLSDNESYFATNENTILVTGGGVLGLYSAINEFVSRINKSNAVELSLKAEEKFTVTSSATRVMSFNVWVSQKTTERTNRVIKMITKYMPDSFGVQEASPSWMTSLSGSLSAYAYVGVGREGGNKGEYSAIFYLKDKYTVVESGTKWLSDTPDKVSKYEDSACYRVCTYAVLKEKSTGKVFVHINTHLDHKGSDAREKQAGVLLDVAKKFKDYPIVMTGDFNCTSGSNPYNKITSAGFVNSYNVATQKHGSSTFHSYGSASSIIDFCFISSGKMAVINYRVCDEKIDGDYVSDHHPLFIDFVY